MVEGYNFFEGSQTDINRRLLRKIEVLEKALENSSGAEYDDTEIKEDITNLETTIGDESTEGSILARLKALEDAT